ncbi:MAG: AAA family ATPase, partial [Planctomycetes bacterium]|nr:AAA family ATPase [Planctomycetota bacterium]
IEPSNSNVFPGWRSVFMSEVDEKDVNWLWPGRIAMGKFSLIAGDPGLGKSFISCDLAARVSTGREWPDGRPSPGAGGVLLLNAEDDESDTVKPRLRAARADMRRILFMYAVDKGRLFTLDKHLHELAACAAAVPDLKLIVVDPVTAFASGIDSHKNADVRQALTPLAEFAKHVGVAVLGVGHLNKSSGPAIYRVTGSLAWTAAARSAWIVAKCPKDRDRRLFLPSKNNIGNDKAGLAYSINGQSDPPFVDWEPDPAYDEIDKVLNNQQGSRPPPRQTMTNTSDDWLEAFLDKGEKPAIEVYEAGRAAGFSEDQLKRSRKRIGAHIRRVGRPSRSFWRLAAEIPDHDHGGPNADDSAVFSGEHNGDCDEASPLSGDGDGDGDEDEDEDEARPPELVADQPVPAEPAIASPSPAFHRLKAAPWLA